MIHNNPEEHAKEMDALRNAERQNYLADHELQCHKPIGDCQLCSEYYNLERIS